MLVATLRPNELAWTASKNQDRNSKTLPALSRWDEWRSRGVARAPLSHSWLRHCSVAIDSHIVEMTFDKPKILASLQSE